MSLNKTVNLRKPCQAMDLTRLGSLHASRLSFTRAILRKVCQENWKINLETFQLDNDGTGHAVYIIHTAENTYSCLIFAHKISDEKRSDRVIANEWDITFGLIEGKINEQDIKILSQSVPLQEGGRNNAKVLVLSRANRSVRNFQYFVECLAQGKQPDIHKIIDVGYLYRTTAVYGNGKFGIADYQRLKNKKDFYRPFSAQMFAVYLLRDFCTRQVEHIAKMQNPDAVALDTELSRFIGIGNATGLGMAPFLINHPALISQWIVTLETAITLCRQQKICDSSLKAFTAILQKASKHFSQTRTVDEIQDKRYRQLEKDIEQALGLLKTLSAEGHGYISENKKIILWDELLSILASNKQAETCELYHSILLEIYPEFTDNLSDQLSDEENYDIDTSMYIEDLLDIINSRYQWTENYDFNDPVQNYWFWYRSEEKEEPRLGIRNIEQGEQKEMHLGIAKRTQLLKKRLLEYTASNNHAYVADFLLLNPEFRGITRRIQSMSKYVYPEIHANLYQKDIRPLDLLRLKLSFFGASKFDPKSDKWVRITMFQGAPLLHELNNDFKDDWYFPVAPEMKTEK